MKPTVMQIISFFHGRRSLLLLLCAFLLIGASMFLVLPSESVWSATVSPAATGGGSSSHERLLTSPAPRETPQAAKPARPSYLTLNPGEVVDLAPGPVSFDGHPAILSRIGASWKFRAQVSGHTILSVGAGKAVRPVYVFVPPLPSRQVTRDDLDWYRTQFGTGIANCGPALVSMAILWARGKDVQVQQIRAEIGYPYDDGATSFEDLEESLRRHGVGFKSPTLTEPQDLQDLLDRGHIAFVLIQSGGIEKVDGDPSTNLVGRYYGDDLGHYVLVKGYSLDKSYFVVYDPYPVDWESNSMRYADEVTMIGKNRYYPAGELFDALRTKMILEVTAD
jgi:hypothetical protein